MIVQLMRRDIPEPPALVFSAFAALTMYVAPRIAPVAGIAFFLMIWAAMRRRGSSFEATLPIRGREIFAARLLWHFALMALPLAAWIYASIVAPTPALPLSRVLDAPLVALLALMLPYAVKPRELYEIPFLITAALWICLAAVCGAVIWLLPPDVAFEALLVAVVVVGHSIWPRIPDALEMEPRKPADARRGRQAPRESKPSRAWVPRAWQPYLYSFFEGSVGSGFFLLLVYAFAFVFGTFGEDGAKAYMLIYFAIFIGRARYDTRWLAAFPISKRARLWSTLAPCMVLPLGIFVLGRLAGPLFLRNHDPMTFGAPREAVGYKSTRVPLEFWRSTSEGEDPVIVAPWGESTVADTFSILGHVVYNPYTSTESNSGRFAEWQFQRATTAVFGMPIGSYEYGRLVKSGKAPRAALSSPRMKILKGALVLTVVLLIVLATEIARSFRIGLRGWRWRIVVWLVALPLPAIPLLELLLAKRGMSDVIQALADEALYRVSGVLPQNLLVLILIAALPVLVTYALLERQFGESEIVERADRSSKRGGFLSPRMSYFRTS